MDLDPSSNKEIESEERYKDLFDNAHDLIYFANIDATLVYVNRSWMQLLGFSQDEIQNKPIYDFVDESDRERFREYREHLIKEQIPGNIITVTLNTKKGEKVHVEGSVSVKVKDGIPIYTRGIFRDITTRLRNEWQLQQYTEELKERERNQQQLLISAPDAVIVIDRESRITFWNPKSEDIFGWTAEEVVGAYLSNIIIPSEYRQAHEQGMKRYLSTGEAHVLNKTIDITALKKTGEIFYISLTISMVRQKGDVSFIAFIRDITSQKMNELELERKRIEIEKSNRELEQFAHVASHDMKEPVRKIKVYTDRLESEYGSELNEQAKIYIHKVIDAADRLNNMVEGVLNYSTVNNSDDPFSIIDLAQIIGEIQQDLELMIEQKEAVIDFDGCLPFEGIHFLIYQLFYNLIINSLKFSRTGVRPVISILCKLLSDVEKVENNLHEGDYIQIIQQDNGIGFDQENAEKIFNTFIRLHSRAEYEGTGLGLTLCKNIVERHQGTISASGKEREGALFTILLPVKHNYTY